MSWISRITFAALVTGSSVLSADEPAERPADVLDTFIAPAVAVLADLEFGEGEQAVAAAGMVPQFQQQLKPVLVAELKFIRFNCDIPVESRPKVKQAGEQALERVAKTMARNQNQPGKQTEARVEIRNALLEALKEVVPGEQFKRFEELSARRQAIQRRTAVRGLVARLDQLLLLSAAQRQQIEQTLLQNWQDRWEQWVNLSMYGDTYLPTVDDNLVVTHLNDQQKTIFNGIMKVEFGFWQQEEPDADDGWWGGPKKKKVQNPARPAPGIGFF